ncbi:MAG TPA: HAD-IA family hydrolase [Polyangiales bacterium]|nr:HAD-IA family hydrolase [Polyangiales bacterium]
MLESLTRRPAALLLDAGDTLIFFDGRALAEVLARHGHSVDPARLQAAQHAAKQRYQALVVSGGQHEDGWSVIIEDTLVSAGVERESARGLLAPVRRAHDELYLWRRVPAGLPEALARAQAAGIKLVVVSNSEGKLAYVLDQVGIGRYFAAVLDSQIEGVHKPDPEIFRRALDRVGVSADRALMAGDIPEVDLGGAAGAGIAGVLIDPEGKHAGGPWPRAESVVAVIDALLALPA